MLKSASVVCGRGAGVAVLLMAVRREARHINYRMHAIGIAGTSSRVRAKASRLVRHK